MNGHKIISELGTEGWHPIRQSGAKQSVGKARSFCRWGTAIYISLFRLCWPGTKGAAQGGAALIAPRRWRCQRPGWPPRPRWRPRWRRPCRRRRWRCRRWRVVSPAPLPDKLPVSFFLSFFLFCFLYCVRSRCNWFSMSARRNAEESHPKR